MAKKCVVCGKTTISGNTISHSHRKTKRRFKPNLQKIHIILNGVKQKAYVCASCIASGKIQKP